MNQIDLRVKQKNTNLKSGAGVFDDGIFDTINIDIPDDLDSSYRYFAASPMFAGFGNLGGPERDKFLQSLTTASVELKNFFTDKETAETIFKIGGESGLIDGQISKLAESMRGLVLGDIFIKDFPAILAKQLQIDEPKALALANRIISELLSPVIEDIKRIQRNKFTNRIGQTEESQGQQPGPEVRPPVPRPLSSRLQGPTNNKQDQNTDINKSRLKTDETAREDLEDQLQKIAGVIDLRNKSNN